jgi:molybdenum cofactor cytidylyltransferase
MRFETIAVSQAAGWSLAHALQVTGRRLKKGHVIVAEDIADLKAAGYERVVAVCLEADDLDENTAAERIARAACGVNLRLSPAATGRCNLVAEAAGVLTLRAEAIHAVNALDEGLTVATLPPAAMVDKGRMAATVKIIPFALPRAVVETAEAILTRASGALGVAAFRPRRAGLVQTVLPGTDEPILEKTVRNTRTRLERLGSTLAGERRCGHEVGAVTAALGQLIDEGCELLLCIGASAIIDRRDVIPSAVVEAGGQVARLGIPADPGNLTMIASLRSVPVLGLPGSFRSPRLHGCDWLLWRLCADLEITADELNRLGVGGLLKEMPGRPLPRERAVGKG